MTIICRKLLPEKRFILREIYGVVIETYGKIFGFREYVRPTHLRKKKKHPTEKGGAE